MRILGAAAAAMACALVMASLHVAADPDCAALASLRLPGGAVTMAAAVAPGAFTPPGARRADAAFTALAGFCRVEATLRPSSDSDIKIEVWLPAGRWNGKLQAVGNGGWGGSIGYAAMASALEHGYATTSTDTGHTTDGASFAFGHPEKLIDYAYRSVHEMTVAATAVAAAFYGTPPARAYFNGCSTGGRQALVEARRYPADFDGIIAGAAANPKAHLDAWRIWIAQAMLKTPAHRIPESKYAVIHAAVLEACDFIDGVKDGLIEHPPACRFDPRTLQCAGSDGPRCLTAPQVEAAEAAMHPVRDRQTGALVFHGFEPGNELGWGRLLGGDTPYPTALDQFRFVVFDPQWDWRTFDLERDVAAGDRAAGGVLAAVDPDLSAFAARGGKLLTYHGWADQSIAPRASIDFYDSARAATRAPADNADWIRLFMVPGMGHCGGGEGPNTFDMVSALDTWVERGNPPARIVASRFDADRVVRTRPLCPYPQVARYQGQSSIDAAASFACAAAP